MRPLFAALCAGVALAPAARAADLRNFEDAALHAVQFVDANEGWAAGDDGVVWHTIDGGRNWERQPTGVRASLRAVHFLNPYTGWVAGREELPFAGGSSGVLLFTKDGGLRWQRVTLETVCARLSEGSSAKSLSTKSTWSPTMRLMPFEPALSTMSTLMPSMF